MWIEKGCAPALIPTEPAATRAMPPQDPRGLSMTDSPPSPPPAEVLALLSGGRDLPCPGCGYNLRGLPSPVCPECGRRLRLEDLNRPPVPDACWVIGAVALTLALVPPSFVCLGAAISALTEQPNEPTVLLLLVYGPLLVCLIVALREWYRHKAAFNARPPGTRLALAILGLLASVVAIGGPCTLFALL